MSRLSAGAETATHDRLLAALLGGIGMSEPIDDYGPAWPREAPDQAVEAVRATLLRRSQVGLKKYDCSTDRIDLSLADWLRHALEEALDLAVYLQRALVDAERDIDDGK